VATYRRRGPWPRGTSDGSVDKRLAWPPRTVVVATERGGPGRGAGRSGGRSASSTLPQGLVVLQGVTTRPPERRRLIEQAWLPTQVLVAHVTYPVPRMPEPRPSQAVDRVRRVMALLLCWRS